MLPSGVSSSVVPWCRAWSPSWGKLTTGQRLPCPGAWQSANSLAPGQAWEDLKPRAVPDPKVPREVVVVGWAEGRPWAAQLSSFLCPRDPSPWCCWNCHCLPWAHQLLLCPPGV